MADIGDIVQKWETSYTFFLLLWYTLEGFAPSSLLVCPHRASLTSFTFSCWRVSFVSTFYFRVSLGTKKGSPWGPL